MPSVCSTIFGIVEKTPGNVLLWKGILRIANEYLQERVKPSKLEWPQRVLALKEKREIETLESENDSAEAVEKLAEKLMKLEKPDWPEHFLKSLRPHFPKVAKSIECLAKQLENDVFSDVTSDTVFDYEKQGKTLSVFH